METIEVMRKKRMAEKKRRIQQLKKIIFVIAFVLLLIPTVCCVLLFFKMKKLENRIDTLVTEREKELASEECLSSSVVEEDKEVEEEEEEQLTQDEGVTKEEELDRTIDTKKVYLTFDDGPGKYTEELLDTLAKYDVKATFFVVGRTDDHSMQMYKKIVDEGHTLAMHSYSHKYDLIYKSEKEFEKDFNKLSDLLYEATGERVQYYRFPGGSSNTVSGVSMTNFISYLNKKGITYFDWNVINGDATGKSLSSEQLRDNVISGVRQHNVSMVLMHDTVSKDTTVKSLPDLIETLQSEDYVILPITKYTKTIQHVKAESVK